MRKLLNMAAVVMTAYGLNSSSTVFANPNLVSLKCSAEVSVPEQPCHGLNSKTLSFQLNLHDSEAFSVFEIDSFYGGCYPVSSYHFGTIEAVSIAGAKVSFVLKARGYRSIGGIPTLYKPSEAAEMDLSGVLDLDTKVVTMDPANTPWYYLKPNVLSCVPLL